MGCCRPVSGSDADLPRCRRGTGRRMDFGVFGLLWDRSSLIQPVHISIGCSASFSNKGGEASLAPVARDRRVRRARKLHRSTPTVSARETPAFIDVLRAALKQSRHGSVHGPKKSGACCRESDELGLSTYPYQQGLSHLPNSASSSAPEAALAKPSNRPCSAMDRAACRKPAHAARAKAPPTLMRLTPRFVRS